MPDDLAAQKLLRMAGQIARALEGRADPAPEIANHINDFWSPVMRQDLLDLAAAQPQDVPSALQAALPLIAGDRRA